MPRPPIEILHLTYSRYPADTRIKRETDVVRATGRRIAIVALRGPGERAVERRAGMLIVRLPGQKSRGGILSYFQEYANFVWRCRRLVATRRQFRHVRLVHVHTLPDFLLWAAIPARRRGSRVVFDMHEIFPEFAASRFPGALGRFFGAISTRIERWARRNSDLTITVNKPIDELLEMRPIGRLERRLVLHNTADPADFGPGGHPSRPPSSHDGRRLHFVYHGTLTRLYGLDTAIRAIADVAPGLDIDFTILGDGPERGRLERLAATYDVRDRIRFEEPISQAALPSRLSECHAGIVPTRLDGMTRYSLSTKLLEYVHLEIPVLAARLPSYERYLDDNCVWYWTPGDPNDLGRAISAFASADNDRRQQMTNNAAAAIATLKWERESVKLLKAYTELLADAPNRSERIAAIRTAASPSP